MPPEARQADDASSAQERQPAPALTAGRLAIGGGQLAHAASQPLDRPLPGIRRALVVIHGMLRNADVYQASGEAAAALVDEPILVVTPQFLAAGDIAHHGGGPDLLHWRYQGWKAGEPALGPAPVSSFAALDALLARLADPAFLPDLRHLTVAGHSAGGQILHRYAAVGRGDEPFARRGVPVRFVIANPSTYLYFSADRPEPVDRAACPGFNRWRFGLEELPAYAADRTPAALEAAYVARDVVYLLGSADDDPDHDSLDRSCAARLQGPSRFRRGKAYAAYLAARHPGLKHRVMVVDGVGHDGRGMFTSAAGRMALFGD